MPTLLATKRAFILLVLLSWVVLLGACGGSSGSGSDSHNDAADGGELDDIYPYISSSYSPILKDCTLAEDIASACRLDQLPLLIELATTPTVDDIMARVLVSHDWMGLRFRQVLETMPPEILQLFGATTSIVIDDDTRPSYYYPATSTVYLDAANLWLTNAEKSTVSREPDYRSGFDDELNFVSLARYVSGFSYAWDYYSLSGNEERDIGAIRLPMAELLLHELMHANDYFPPDQTPYLDQAMTVYQAYQAMGPWRIAVRLDASEPLQSVLMKGLARVMYHGDSATQAQRELSAAQVGAAMEADGASDDYAYASIAEDAAMLFGEAMMKYLFNIDRDIAYSNRPPSTGNCDDYIVGWGMRGRIGDSNVKTRAQLVVSAVYPGADFSLFFQNLAVPLFMRSGESWCDNLALF